MVISIVVMGFIATETCRAGWVHVYSDVSSDPPSGYNYDSDSGATWAWEYEEGYLVENIDRSADSSGAYASADCRAYSSGQAMTWGAGYASVSPSSYCGAWGWSAYAYQKEHPWDTPDTLYVEWSIEGSGTVSIGGGIEDDYLDSGDSASSSAYAYADISGYESGSGYASGSVSEFEYGEAYADVGGYATEDSSDVYDGYDEWYYAELSFSVEASDEDPLVGYWQFDATASVGASSGGSVYVSTSQGYSGSGDTGSEAEFGGTSSVGVSW
jgi:hypothetical protein